MYTYIYKRHLLKASSSQPLPRNYTTAVYVAFQTIRNTVAAANYFWLGGALSASACDDDDDGGGVGEARLPNCQCKNCCWCTKSLKLT